MFTHLLLRSFSEDSGWGKIVESSVNGLVRHLVKRHKPEGFHIPVVSRVLWECEVLERQSGDLQLLPAHLAKFLLDLQFKTLLSLPFFSSEEFCCSPKDAA